MSYDLWLDCTTIACKIANLIDDHYLERVTLTNIAQLEIDFYTLSTALDENDTKMLRGVWNQYHPMLKRYN